MIRYQLLLGVALFVGAAVGFFLAPKAGSDDVESATVSRPTAVRSIADAGGQASEQALRARIAALERELADARRGVEGEDGVSNAVQRAVAERPPRLSWRESMEQFRKNNPERYARVTNSIARFRAQRRERRGASLEFLASVDTSGFSASARKALEDLQELIVRREECDSRLHDENLTDDERATFMQEMRDSFRQVHELNEQVRENLLRETVKAAGLEGEIAEDVYVTVQEVIKATQDDRGIGRHGGRGRGGPPPAER